MGTGYINGGASLMATKQYAEDSYSDQKQIKVKKMGFFKRWLLKSVKEAVHHERERDVDTGRQLIAKGLPAIDQPDRAIQFTVYTANGGRVVETRRYDRHKDRHLNGLYVITGDQEFGKEIDKIITMESLK